MDCTGQLKPHLSCSQAEKLLAHQPDGRYPKAVPLLSCPSPVLTTTLASAALHDSITIGAASLVLVKEGVLQGFPSADTPGRVHLHVQL